MIHYVASSYPFLHVGEVVAVDLVKLYTSRDIIQLTADHVVDPDNLVSVSQHYVCEVAA
jgi:hypothetical protein